MYRAGTELTLFVSGSAESFWTSLDFWNGVSSPRLASDVTDYLRGRVDVFSLQLRDRGLSDLGTWQYQATMTVASHSDHAKPEDVAAIVANAFYEITGYTPQISLRPQDPLLPGAFDGLGSIFSEGLGKGLGSVLGLAVVGVGLFLYLKAK